MVWDSFYNEIDHQVHLEMQKLEGHTRFLSGFVERRRSLNQNPEKPKKGKA
jgi:hypothetical protein